MRILYSHRIQSRDGQSVHVEELITAFLQEGHEVMVVGPSFYAQAGFGGDSGRIRLLRRLLPGVLGELAELAYNVPAYLRLRRACIAFRPDLIYERCNVFYLAGAWVARRFGVRFFLEVNSPLAAERIRHGGLRLGTLAHRLEQWTWRAADRVLAVTGVLAATIAAAGVEPGRIAVVPNGVVLDRFLPAPFGPTGVAAERPVLGFVGFVRSWHGLDAVIRAMAAHAEATPVGLVVIGEGPARAELEQLAEKSGIAERVHFTGLVDHVRVPDLVAGFTIALQPRVVDYASPLKIFDYMAAGRPIVAPDQPNIREILSDGETALLFDPARPEAMWEAVARLVADPALRDRLGTAARTELEARDYTWRGNAARIAAMAAAPRME